MKMIPKSSCVNCQERYVGCHSVCDKYKEYRKKLDEFNEAVRKSKNEDADYVTYKLNAAGKLQRMR